MRVFEPLPNSGPLHVSAALELDSDLEYEACEASTSSILVYLFYYHLCNIFIYLFYYDLYNILICLSHKTDKACFYHFTMNPLGVLKGK